MNKSQTELKLHHNIITLPEGKKASDVVSERHDIVFLFDANKANPNGDPDAGNMPRVQPDSLRGLVTDVCLKRKVRNFFSLYSPDGSLRLNVNGNVDVGYEIFISENAIFQEKMEAPAIESLARGIFQTELGQNPGAWDAKRKKKSKKGEPVESTEADATEELSAADDQKKQSYRMALCKTYFDLRSFGGVISTEGPLKGSFYGQVRGPLQFTFAESLDRILQLDATITRCAIASDKERGQTEGADSEAAGNRTMGRKYLVDYGLYRAHIYLSPAFAAKTDFSYYDLDNFLFALKHLFRDDAAAGRSGMRVVGLVDFQHASALGDEHAHKLFEKVFVERKPESKRTPEGEIKDFPGGLSDYHGSTPGEANTYSPVMNDGNGNVRVTAKQLIWEIPTMATT